MVEPRPADLWEKLFAQEAVRTVLEVVREHRPRVVLTTSWLLILERSGFVEVFRATGLHELAECLHEHYNAPQNRGESRLGAISRWLNMHHQGESFVVLGDHYSGTELAGSYIDDDGRLVLCGVGVGLQAAHANAIRRALK